jgi:hypothetical protein
VINPGLVVQGSQCKSNGNIRQYFQTSFPGRAFQKAKDSYRSQTMQNLTFCVKKLLIHVKKWMITVVNNASYHNREKEKLTSSLGKSAEYYTGSRCMTSHMRSICLRKN